LACADSWKDCPGQIMTFGQLGQYAMKHIINFGRNLIQMNLLCFLHTEEGSKAYQLSLPHLHLHLHLQLTSGVTSEFVAH